MPFHEFECPFHGVVTIKLPTGEATGDFRPCPEKVRRVVETSGEEIGSICGEESKHVFPVPHKMLLDRRTMRKHTYPAEHGLDDDPRLSPRDPDFLEKAEERRRDKKSREKRRKIFTGDLGKPAMPLAMLPSFPTKGGLT